MNAKRLNPVRLLGIAFAGTAVLVAVVWAGVYATRAEVSVEVTASEPVESPTSMVLYRRAESITELVAEADVVVIGTVLGAVGIHNTARLESDPFQEDPRVYSRGRLYEIQVKQYLHGAGPPLLTITQHEAIGKIPEDGDPAEWPVPSGIEPMETGQRYLWFLKQSESDPRIYFGFAEPSRYVLTGDTAVPSGNYVDSRGSFDDLSESGLVSKVLAVRD